MAWRLAENQSQFHTHLMDSIFKKLEAGKLTLLSIPGGLTSVLQPLDVSLNKPFRDNVRSLRTEWTAGDHSENEYTKSGRLRKPSIALWCNWIIKAWDQIDPAAIVKSFKVCCISNALGVSIQSSRYR